jgi:predicted amidohydrolase
VAGGAIDLIAAQAHAARRQGARLAVFPEGSMHDARPGVDLAAIAEPLDGRFVSGLSDLARTTALVLVAGMWERTDADTRPSNTVVVIGEDGSLVCAYRKIHLFDSFAESDRIIPGPVEPVTFELDGFGFGIMTCYDVRFPELARALSAAGADALVVPAGWVAGPGKLHHWRTLITARAIENTCYVLAAGLSDAGYTGHSLVVDPMGEVGVELGEVPGTGVADLERRRLDHVRSTLPSLRHRRM